MNPLTEIQLLIAETLLKWSFRLMPDDSDQKERMAMLIIRYFKGT